MRVTMLAAVCVIALFVPWAEASCSNGRLKSMRTVYGTRSRYCEYKGLKILPGSNIKDVESCMEVTCSRSGLSICGFGIKAGRFDVPPGCKLVSDGCKPRYVDDPRSRTQCREI